MNKKAIYESIMKTVSLEVKKALNEYRTKAVQEEHEIDVNDVQKYLKKSLKDWVKNKIEKIPELKSGIYDRWGGRGISVDVYEYGWFSHSYSTEKMPPTQLYGTVEGVGYVSDDLETIHKYFTQHKEFKIKSAKIKSIQLIKFDYDATKDVELYQAIENAKKQHETDVINADTTAYAPTERDWVKMVGYMNGHSNPERVAKSCKDPNKVVARCIIAKTLGWKEAEREFRYRIRELKILSDIEIEAYQRKYATYNIPDDVKMLVDDTAEFDETGGIAANNIENSEILPENVKRYIHKNTDIRSYKIELLGQIPIKNYNRRRRFSSSYQCGTANLAKVTFKMIDGSEKVTYFAYKYGEYQFFGGNYQPKETWKEDMGKGSHPVHNLEYIFGK